VPLTGEIASSSLPTMKASDAERGGRGDLLMVVRGNASPSNRYKLWPTPTSDDTALRQRPYAQGGTPLSLAARTWPTPNATDGSKAPKYFARGNPSLPQAVKDAEGGGSLSPTWVEWLMGFPLGWTDLEDSATP
jgi:hypothetical protein